MDSNVKIFLQSIFVHFEYSVQNKEMLLTPCNIASLSLEQLELFIKYELIGKIPFSRKAWCCHCYIICKVETENNKNFFICNRCASYENINETNLLQYSINLNNINKFLQNIIVLDNLIESVAENRLFYLGSKAKYKYYFFLGVNRNNLEEILNNMSMQSYTYILILEHNHDINIPQSYNILNFLSLENNVFYLNLPEILYINTIASKGGKARANRNNEVKEFIINKYYEITRTESKKNKSTICNEIADELRKENYKKFLGILKPDNLEQFIGNTIRTHKKDKKSFVL